MSENNLTVADDMMVSLCFTSARSSCEDAYMLDYGNEGTSVYKHIIARTSDKCSYTLFYKGDLMQEMCWMADDAQQSSIDC